MIDNILPHLEKNAIYEKKKKDGTVFNNISTEYLPLFR